MLSYRHGFHAGNFADVLKHFVLNRILAHLVSKPKPFCCIDTHAGAGVYDLGAPYAQKNREFERGIGLLWDRSDLPPPLAAYVDVVRGLNGKGGLRRYPGSPFFERLWLRQEDRLMLYELHPADAHALAGFAGDDGRIRVERRDGFKACIALLPPRERRGLIVMDPSYELKSDYREVVQTLTQAWRRFPTGVYALWYPVIERRRVNTLERALQASGIERVQLFELGVRPEGEGAGMSGSGMVVINAPYTLAGEMAETLPWLARVLGQEGGGYHRMYGLGPQG